MKIRLRTINNFIRRLGFVLVVRTDDTDPRGATYFWLTTERNNPCVPKRAA